MKYLTLIFIVFLVGCSTAVPVKMKFPDVPEALMQKCEDLEQLPANTTQLSKTAESVIKNYSKYHQCRIKVDEWQEWYKANKKLYDDIK
jgi:hypothetical protein